MKTLLVLLAVLTLPAHAAELSCHVSAEDQQLNDNYDLTISGSEYTIEHYGHSRNKYSALYQLKQT